MAEKKDERLILAAYMHGVRTTKQRGAAALGASRWPPSKDARHICCNIILQAETPALLPPHDIAAITAEAEKDPATDAAD